MAKIRSRRANKKLTSRELELFLFYLARTGNFAFACDRLGRAKSGLYKRRARDPLFDAQCKGAIARSRSSLWRTEGGRRGPAADARSATILSTYAGRPQLRRAAPGTLTRAGEQRFLYALALSGNIRFAAARTGLAASSIHHRRRTHPEFAVQVEAALDTARANLELRLIEASGVFSDDFLAPPVAGPDDDSAHPELVEGFTTRMTVSEAIRLVRRLKRKLAQR